MKNQRLAFFLLTPLLVAPASAEKLDWQTVKKIPPGTHIFVTTQVGTGCSLQKVTDDQLFCTVESQAADDSPNERPERVFDRDEIRDVRVGETVARDTFDESAGVPFLIAAAGAGGGWRPGYQPHAFGGVKLGLAGLTMDLQYDRLNSQNGFSIEGSGLVPLFRVPRWRPRDDRLLFRLYAEPGLGYRAGDGPFGQYASGKVLMLIGKKWLNDGVSPYIEYQRRFPFDSPLGATTASPSVSWSPSANIAGWIRDRRPAAGS